MARKMHIEYAPGDAFVLWIRRRSAWFYTKGSRVPFAGFVPTQAPGYIVDGFCFGFSFFSLC